MASAASILVSAFPDGKDLTMNHLHVYGTVSISAGTYPAHGIPLKWASSEIPTQLSPSFVEFMSIGSPPGTFDYVWDKASGTIRILTASGGSAGTSPFQEFTTGAAVNNQIVNDTIEFHAIFRRN